MRAGSRPDDHDAFSEGVVGYDKIVQVGVSNQTPTRVEQKIRGCDGEDV